jgi:hypothetical protein
MTSLPIRIASAVLIGFGLVGCGSGLSLTDSRASTDPVPLFERMVVISADYGYGNGIHSELPPMIETAFRNAAARCGIKIDFVYEWLDQQPVGTGRVATSGMELSIVPNIVFDDKSHLYRFSSRYGYTAMLADRSKKLEYWKASFFIKPLAFLPGQDFVRFATSIPDTLFARMAQDGVVTGCPPADQNGGLHPGA